MLVTLVFLWSESKFILFGGKLRINTQGVKRFYENWKICSSINEATHTGPGREQPADGDLRARISAKFNQIIFHGF